MQGKFLFLGTGGSSGVPVVSCHCEVCSSIISYNKRFRTSGLLQVNGKNILIDTSPDFRLQALQNKIDQIDGVIITHTHFDHIGGLDELRIFSFLNKGNIPCLLSLESLNELKKRYYYLFQKQTHGDSSTVLLDFTALGGKNGEINFLDIPIRYFTYLQGSMSVLGFRIGDFAYITDIKMYEEDIFLELQNVETLVLSALRKTPSSMHFNLSEAINFARRAKVKKTFLTHIAHELDHDKTNKELPVDIQLGYDGLNIGFTW